MPEDNALSHEEVRAIAELAKLDLTDEEVALYASQLSELLNYFQQLQEVDTSHIEATASVLPLRSVMRPDAPQPALPTDQAIANAPDAEASQFRVPEVLGGE